MRKSGTLLINILKFWFKPLELKIAFTVVNAKRFANKVSKKCIGIDLLEAEKYEWIQVLIFQLHLSNLIKSYYHIRLTR